LGKREKKKISTPDVVAETIAKREKRKIDQTLEASPIMTGDTDTAFLNKSQENPTLIAVLARMEKQQREQAQLLNNLMQQVGGRNLQTGKKDPVSVSATSNENNELESCFEKFLAAYNRVPLEERSNKVRKIMNSEKAAEVAEVLFMNIPHTIITGNATPFTAYLNSIAATNPLDISSHCQASDSNPENFDRFYADLLSSPSSDLSDL